MLIIGKVLLTEQTTTIDQALQTAMLALKERRFQETERYCKAILKKNPHHSDANHVMALLAVTIGKKDQALPFFDKAFNNNKYNPKFMTAFIITLMDLNHSVQAKELIRQVRNTVRKEIKTFEWDQKFSDIEALTQLNLEERKYHLKVMNMRNSNFKEYPAHVHLETYTQCNAACNFCPYPDLERQGKKMSDELIDKIISDLQDIPRTHQFQLSPFKVNEPFLDNRIFGLLEKVNDCLPNASVTLTTNSTPLTEEKLLRLGAFDKLEYLWVSFNDHRKSFYEQTMNLPYERTVSRLDMMHSKKEEGVLKTRVVLSRVGDGSTADPEFKNWVKENYPLFETSVFQRCDWLGQVDSDPTVLPPDMGCIRWFDVSIMSSGIVAHCCADGKGDFPIGDVNKSHILEIYNEPLYRKLRESTTSRLTVEPCRGCNFL